MNKFNLIKLINLILMYFNTFKSVLIRINETKQTCFIFASNRVTFRITNTIRTQGLEF